ncbi:unnamed protein product [Effrenium voratum]|uniref:Uncharacterized protein n=1 Tax=Effrenium voratum TaxID=2562239 RepID=A0AA36IQG1_9DINO|nr:unnamed protein product [Effrenium voratum]
MFRVLGFCLVAWARAEPACTSRAVESAAPARPCLCAFDVDRTLTGFQELLSECPRNLVMEGIKDYAYLYATPRGFGFLTLSQLSQGLNTTFCRNCYLGIASAGGVGLDDEKQAILAALKAAASAEASAAMPNWTTEADVTLQEQTPPPFVAWCPEGQKHLCTAKIVEWYRARDVPILDEDVYFFDDKEDNVRPFTGTSYNALQVSCGTRNGTRGLCGGTLQEAQPAKGVFLCHGAAQVCAQDLDSPRLI